MSVVGDQLEQLRLALSSGFTGVNFAGGGTPNISGVSRIAEDDLSVGIGAANCSNFGVVARVLDAGSLKQKLPRTAGGSTQRRCQATLLVEMGVDSRGCTGSTLAANLTPIMAQMVDTAEATLEPQAGANYALQSWKLGEARRLGPQSRFYVLSLKLVVVFYWEIDT